MPPPLSVDDPGIQAVLNALGDANDTTKAVRSSVNAAEAGLNWSGDASAAYKNSLAGWLDGLTQVENGMQMMNDAMRGHQVSTNGAEAFATGASAWWR